MSFKNVATDTIAQVDMSKIIVALLKSATKNINGLVIQIDNKLLELIEKYAASDFGWPLPI